MKVFSLILSLCVLSTTAVELAYFEGRSGKIILQPENVQEGSIMQVKTPFDQSGEHTSIEETSIADFISHVVGGPVVSLDASRKFLQSASVFNKAKANVMFVVNDAKELTTDADFGKRMEITRMFYPQDFTASLATLSTGSSPSVHGIVSESWTSNNIEVRPLQAGAMVENLYDTVNRAFDSRSLLISASADLQAAWITAPHFDTRSRQNHIYYFDSQANKFQNLAGTRSLNLTRAKIIDNLAQRYNGKSIQGLTGTFSIEGNQFTLGDITFDASKKADMQFLSEIEMVYAIIDQVKSDSLQALVSDEVPDLYTFTFDSLRYLSQKYGRSAPNYIGAQYIVRDVIAQAIDAFETIYSNKIAIEVVYQKTPIAVEIAMDTKTMNFVYEKVEQYLDGSKTTFKAHYPSIYLRPTVSSDAVCSQLEKVLPMAVECPEPSFFPGFDDWMVMDDANNGTNNNGTTGFTSTEAYQIVLWSSIILLVALLMTVYFLFTMDVGQDSMLYRDSGKVPTI